MIFKASLVAAIVAAAHAQSPVADPQLESSAPVADPQLESPAPVADPQLEPPVVASPVVASPVADVEVGCSVCGDGLSVQAPDVIFSFPGQPTVPCGLLQDAGLNGAIPLDLCKTLLPFISVCECGVPPLPTAPPGLGPGPDVIPCPEIPDSGCSVCGEGFCVSSPDAVFTFPGLPSVPCGLLQDAGLGGSIPEAQCLFLPAFIEVCECSAGVPAAPTPATAAPTAAGVAPIPTVAIVPTRPPVTAAPTVPRATPIPTVAIVPTLPPATAAPVPAAPTRSPVVVAASTPRPTPVQQDSPQPVPAGSTPKTMGMDGKAGKTSGGGSTVMNMTGKGKKRRLGQDEVKAPSQRGA